jgi:hypothetical protein
VICIIFTWIYISEVEMSGLVDFLRYGVNAWVGLDCKSAMGKGWEKQRSELRGLL